MSVKRIIYQIGRFDSSIDEKVNFEIDGKHRSGELSSFALKEYFGEHTKVILVYPVSILLNEGILLNKKALEEMRSKESLRSFYEKIKGFLEGEEEEKEKEKEKYIKNPWEYLKEHPHSNSKKADGFIVIPSIGEFLGEKFSSPLGNIILRILIDMIERYKNEPFDEMYLDISSGHNIYTYALVEAGRLFLTLMKLEDFLKEKDIKVFIAITEPIFGKPSPDKRYKIFKDFQLDAKGFFYFPEKPKQNNEYAFSTYAGRVSSIIKGEEDGKLKGKINDMLYKTYLFYSALKNNLPLVVYYLCVLKEPRDKEDKEYRYTYTEDDVKNLLEEIVNLLKQRLDENLKESPDLNFDDLRKLFMMLGLAVGIIRVLEKCEICKGIKEEVEVCLKDIERLFAEEESSIYVYFGLKTNIPYLRQEIRNNFKEKDEKNLITNEWKLLKYILEEKPNEKDTQIHPRNVLAHCGFERNITEVRKTDDGEILIRYTNYHKENNNEYNGLEKIFKEKIVQGVLLRYREMD
ncbi:MAG: CRISPR-associated CARF protein Csx1 [Thermocrinis sp.]|jgi:CRISPR-associated protein Csx1|uniref:CRISPR-associated CARF protein Csx1 n=1 Tax=Thermocrinis sp. TaxID=2024383 RepID=UPI003BFB0960